MTVTRSVQIAKSFRPGVSIEELSFYRPGTLESSSITFNTVYSGKITELAVFPGIRTLQDVSVWIEDAGGERFTVLPRLRLKPSDDRIDLLGIIGGGNPLSISPNAVLGMTLSTPDRRATTDEITVLGYAEEVGTAIPVQATVLYGVTDGGTQITDNGEPVIDIT